MILFRNKYFVQRGKTVVLSDFMFNFAGRLIIER